jgi:kumamolisin
VANKDLVIVPGSERPAMAPHATIGPTDPNETVDVTMVLKPANAIDPSKVLPRLQATQLHGASLDAMTVAAAFAAAHGLQVVEANTAARTVKLRGKASDMTAAFNTQTQRAKTADGVEYRARQGAIYVPADLAPFVEAVLGIDNHPLAKPRVLRRDLQAGFLPTAVAKAYEFPQVSSKCFGIAYLELGGGYDPQSLAGYMQQELGISATVNVTVIGTDGATNQTGSDADGEVQLDLLIGAAICPEANHVLGFGVNTTAGFYNILSALVHDTAHNIVAIGISWGSAEEGWPPQARNAFEMLAQQAAAMGITITAAAGDSGSGDGVGDGRPHTDCPGCCPSILCCGGTQLLVNADGSWAAEQVWNDGQNGGATGGGISKAFAVPAYQKNLKNLPGRGVPDVAGVASPMTGWRVWVNGQPQIIGGTSAVAPMMAAFKVLLTSALGKKIGLLQPLFYANPAAFRGVLNGTNGAYNAGPGWNPCCGVGTPRGTRIVTAAKGPVGPPPVQPPVIGGPVTFDALIVALAPLYHLKVDKPAAAGDAYGLSPA